MAKLLLNFDDDLKNKVRAIADLEDATMTDVITQSIKDFIEGYAHKEKVEKIVKLKEEK